MGKTAATPAGVGHNQGIVGEELRQFVERVERLQEERAGINEDIRDVIAEAKGRGYDAKTLRRVIQRRKMDAAEREQQDAMLELYEGIFAR